MAIIERHFAEDESIFLEIFDMIFFNLKLLCCSYLKSNQALDVRTLHTQTWSKFLLSKLHKKTNKANEAEKMPERKHGFSNAISQNSKVCQIT